MESAQANPETSVFDDLYYKETQEEIWQFGRRKVMNYLLIVGGLFFLGDLITLSMTNLLDSTTILYALVVPVIHVGLWVLARSKPVLAIVLAMILFGLIVLLNIYALGVESLIRGILVKGVIVYLFISGYRYAKEAEDAKKSLEMIK